MGEKDTTKKGKKKDEIEEAPAPTRQKIVATRDYDTDGKAYYKLSAYDEMRSKLACKNESLY